MSLTAMSWAVMEKRTNYTEQGPSLDASSSSASQAFECLLHKNLPFVSILSQINPVKVFTGRFSKSFNLLLPFTPRSSKWSLSLMFLHKILLTFLSFAIRATSFAHLILHIRIIFVLKYKSLSSSLCNFLQYPVTSSL